MATVTEIKSTSTPTTRIEPEVGERRFVIHNLNWDGYETLLRLFGDDGPRMNYTKGSVELMSPLIPHERPKKLIGFMIECVTEELDIPSNALGSTTFKKRLADRALEADDCYYIANAGRLGRHHRQPDLDVDPPPDLAIEIEITNRLIAKLGTYAGIGVPEIWRYDGESLRVLLLRPGGTYEVSEISLAFPFLPMADVVRFLRDHDPDSETRWRRSFRLWVREVLLPIYNAARPD